jgi:hypothetical protein
MSGVDRDWVRRLVAPAADLAIVGTKSWIGDDLEAVLARGDDRDGDSLASLLLPRTEKSATWFSRIYSSSGFADQLPLPDDVLLTILDGQGAIKYLNDVLSPVVVCVFDRSITDESAAEQVVQLRNSRGSRSRCPLSWAGLRLRESGTRIHGGAMTPRIIGLDQRYAASASLVRYGVEIITVRDERGARFDSGHPQPVPADPEGWAWGLDHLAGAAKALRWRLITDPMPIAMPSSRPPRARWVVRPGS